MCSHWTPSWLATDAMHSFSHWEVRKLGVTIENCTACSIANCRKDARTVSQWQFDSQVETRLARILVFEHWRG
jgi:hypothetical protein